MTAPHARPFFLLAVALVAAACASIGPSTSSTRVPGMQTFDSLFAQYGAPGMPGASVLVVRDGQVIVNRSYGLADVEAGIPNTDSTNYRLASLSKQFTATAIALLVRDGRLTYDQRVTELLPEVPAYARAVTVRHLLSHTSGIPDYEDYVPRGQTEQVKDRDVPGLLAKTDSMYFTPGSAHKYSNSGYALLALIVEKLSGQPYARFLDERIFTPLGMTGTVAYEAGVSTVPNRAYGYSLRTNGVARTDQSSTSAVLGDGGIYSSMRDLMRWDRALDEGTLLTSTELERAWTPARLTDGMTTRYGFGWFTERENGSLRISHHGETSGFTNFFLKYPERRLTVIILTNRRGGTPWDLAATIAALPEFAGSSALSRSGSP